MELLITDHWRATFPGAVVGALAMDGVVNPPHHPALREHVQKVESELRSRYAKVQPSDLAALPEIESYGAHYKRFGKTYHVRLQLQSLVFKDKPLSSTSALVEAMFASEVGNLLLTAGHDLDAVDRTITVEASKGGEEYVSMGGREQVLKGGDMMMRDQSGIISSVLYGPDQCTRLGPETRRAIFTVYATAGIGAAAVRRHLEEVAASVRLVAPRAVTTALETYDAS